MAGKKRVRSCIFLVLTFLAACATSWASENDLPEVQAAFFFNFIKYTTWPAPERPAAPLSISVLQNPDVVTALSAAADKPVHGRPLNIFDCASPAELTPADAVFIPSRAAATMTDADWQRLGPGTLVVSDAADALDKGGTIQLVTLGGKLRFNISLRKATGIEISSKLLRLALEVRH